MAVERQGVKGLVNAMLFASRPLGGAPRNLRGSLPRKGFKPLVAAILKRHAAIAESFHCGLGHRLSFLESRLLIDILGRLEAESIIGLPLHDSVLVPVSNAERVKTIMEQAFRDHFGGLQAPVDIKRTERD